MPFPLRFPLAFDGKLLGQVVRIFTDTVAGWYRHRIMKRPEMRCYTGSEDVPKEDWNRAFGEEAAHFPSPLGEKRSRPILDEEARAWTFASAIVEAFVPDIQQEAVVEARDSLEPYCFRLGLSSEPDWTPNVAKLCLSPEDRRYISELATPG
jgi:hypothetical protein